MENIKFKPVQYSLVILTVLFATSCLKDNDDDIETRTPELENEELNNALSLLDSEGYDIDTTELGIYYIVREEGEGPLVQAGDILRLEYTGSLLDGTIFDASSYHYADGIWEFVFKEIQLISGFEDGISLMNKGAEIYMIIPSEHAYGAYGNGIIEPYTPLLFETILHDINPTLE